MATYISGLCLPTVMLSTGVPYNVTTLEQLTADIAALNAILDNACVTPTPPPALGFELTWNDIANSPFVTHTDLNTFINGNGGAANYTSVVTVGNVQTFYGGTAVDLGDSFMAADANIVSIRDEAFQVVAQGTNCEKACDLLETIALPALIVQVDDCQNGNAALTSLNLQSLTTQGINNQSGNASLVSISLPSLTTQTSDNQSNNAIATVITLNVLTTQGSNNQRNNTLATDILLPLLTTQGSNNQSNNAALTKLILQALETQVDSNQISNNAMTTLTLPSLTSQAISNQSNNLLLATLNMPLLTSQGNNNQNANPALTLIATPLLTTLGFSNYIGCTFPILTIDVDASLFGAADILLAQAGGATII